MSNGSMNVSDLIVGTAHSLLPVQGADGAFPSGHNGPYYDDELPLRNTAHVLMLLLKAHALSGEQYYRDAALKALDYVAAGARRPMNATFWIRRNPRKDFSNGLIGQAWVIEALAYAARQLEDEQLETLAESVFLMHPFNEDLARWQVVNVDGSYDPVDMTFNHQLWFAAAGGGLQRNDKVIAQVRHFLDKLDVNLVTYANGLVVHALGGGQQDRIPLKRRLKQLVKSTVLDRGRPACMDPVINKAIGYHAFNTYAFGLLRNSVGEHAFWGSEKFSEILDFPLSDLYREGLEYFAEDPAHSGKVLPFNRFGYPYNPPGIEMAFTVQSFRAHYGEQADHLISTWLGRQIGKTFDMEAGLMNRQTDDPPTLAARMYEAVRLTDFRFSQAENTSA